MVLHAPSIHFHIGAWFVTAVCTMLALGLNFLQRRELLNSEKWFGTDIVKNLDFTAHVTGIIGLGGILMGAYLGLIDASGVDIHFSFQSLEDVLNTILFFLDFTVPLKGFETGINNQILGYKIIWTVVGMQLYLISGIIRLYFVTIRKIKISEIHLGIQLIQSVSSLVGFIVMISIAATGGMYSYSESFIEEIPILQNLLPNSEFLLLPVLIVLFGFFAILMILSSFFLKQKEAKS